VRHSRRAKHVHVKVIPFEGVVVVVPNGIDTRVLPGLVEQHRAWIMRKLALIESTIGPMNDEPDVLPAGVNLRANDEAWRVRYAQTKSRSVRVTEADASELRVSGALDNANLTVAALRRWLARRARAHLTSRLDELSAAFDLPYGRASIRFQRSRWGSCSASGAISLNARLMFLPAHLVRCVLTHELCHTVHMNHGAEFYALLDALQPRHAEMRPELRDGWRNVPVWALA
jgi:predicted metal-dependent hydrolase